MTHITRLLNRHRRTTGAFAIGSLFILAPIASHAQVVRSGAGTSTDVQTILDLFRTDLGGGTVGGANGSFGGLRREINWDGVAAAAAAPNNLPGNFFAARGVGFSTPGSGLQVSSASTDPGFQPAAANFGNINASYVSVFTPFSAQRLFTPIGSNITDVTFFTAGTSTPGLTRGFGSIFSDVDLANITSIQFFDGANSTLGTFFVPNVPGGTAPKFSFLGVSFATPIVRRVRITTGNAALGAAVNDNNGDPTDLVVMDDFVFAEVATIVPEPATVGLLAFGLAAIAMSVRRRRV